VRRPRFDPGEVARARAEQLASFEQEKDEPHAFAGARPRTHALPRPSLRRLADGTPESVARSTAHALRAWHARLFTPAQSIVYVVGDIGPEDALARVRSHFAGWPAGAALPLGVPPPAITPDARRVYVIDRADSTAANLLIGHEGISRRDPERVTDLVI
jgi:zinc protease